MAGGYKSTLYLVPVSKVDEEAIPVDTSSWVEGVDYDVYADEAARDTAVSSPSGGEGAYITALGYFQQYNSTSSKWERVSPVLITGTHLFAGTDGFIKVIVTEDKSTMEVQLPEEKDVTGKGFRPRFGLPGQSIEHLEFAKMTSRDKFIVLRPAKNGDVHQFGTIEEPCDIQEVEMPSGEGSTSYRGQIFEIQYDAENFFIYQGAITLQS